MLPLRGPPFTCDDSLPITCDDHVFPTTCDDNQHHQHHGWGGVGRATKKLASQATRKIPSQANASPLYIGKLIEYKAKFVCSKDSVRAKFCSTPVKNASQNRIVRLARGTWTWQPKRRKKQVFGPKHLLSLVPRQLIT